MATCLGSGKECWPVVFDTRMSFRTIRAVIKHYRVTYVYRVVSMDLKFHSDDRSGDPFFVAKVSMAFCNTQEDTFTRRKGYDLAINHGLHSAVIDVPVYVGQTLKDAIERMLSRLTSSELQKLHVPSKLCSYYHLRRPKGKRQTCKDVMKQMRQQYRSVTSRGVYNAAIKAGKTREEAIAMARSLDGDPAKALP